MFLTAWALAGTHGPRAWNTEREQTMPLFFSSGSECQLWVTVLSRPLSAGIVSEQGPLPEQVPPILQHHMLKVALELPANKFMWLKAQVGSGVSSLLLPIGWAGFSLHPFTCGSCQLTHLKIKHISFVLSWACSHRFAQQVVAPVNGAS